MNGPEGNDSEAESEPAALMRLGAEATELAGPDFRSYDYDADLYDADGLPKSSDELSAAAEKLDDLANAYDGMVIALRRWLGPGGVARVPTGWAVIVSDLLETLDLYLGPRSEGWGLSTGARLPQVLAVEERGGELRVSIADGAWPRWEDSRVFGAVVEMAELVALRTCRVCGVTGQHGDAGVFCAAHARNRGGYGGRYREVHGSSLGQSMGPETNAGETVEVDDDGLDS